MRRRRNKGVSYSAGTGSIPLTQAKICWSGTSSHRSISSSSILFRMIQFARRQNGRAPDPFPESHDAKQRNSNRRRRASSPSLERLVPVLTQVSNAKNPDGAASDYIERSAAPCQPPVCTGLHCVGIARAPACADAATRPQSRVCCAHQPAWGGAETGEALCPSARSRGSAANGRSVIPLAVRGHRPARTAKIARRAAGPDRYRRCDGRQAPTIPAPPFTRALSRFMRMTTQAISRSLISMHVGTIWRSCCRSEKPAMSPAKSNSMTARYRWCTPTASWMRPASPRCRLSSRPIR